MLGFAVSTKDWSEEQDIKHYGQRSADKNEQNCRVLEHRKRRKILKRLRAQAINGRNWKLVPEQEVH